MRKLTTEEFIIKAVAVHDSKYDYGKVQYIAARTRVTITCSIHGDFEQRPNDHLHGCGCPGCGGKTQSTTEKFIAKAKLVHGDRYLYDKTVYDKAKLKVVLTCKIHGDFKQSANNHLNGFGCQRCAGTGLLTQEEFIAKSGQAHESKYQYDKVVYINNRTKVTITCPTHGNFEQAAGSHLKGIGCPNCATSGFDKNKPVYLYYLKVTTDSNQILYKIGITNRTVEERFNLIELSKIEIVKQKLYTNGQDALDWEQKLLKQFKEYQYKGPNVLESGNTELFTVDILELLNLKECNETS